MKLPRRRFLELFASTALTATAVAAFVGIDHPIPVIDKAHAQSISALMEPGPMGDKWLGEEDAPVTIIEYASMTCPHCAHFHADTLPAIKEKYIDTGKARLIFREYPVSPRDVRSIGAFMLARCADDDKYFPMVDVLFQRQTAWARADNPIPVLLSIAKLAGFSQESFDACLKNQSVMDSVLTVRNRAEDHFGVTGTPTFFINGEKHSGNKSVDEFSALIEDHL